MKNQLPFVPMVQVFLFMMGFTISGQTTANPNTTTPVPATTATTTGHPGQNLKGKMFTLSWGGGDISFSSPKFSPSFSTPSYTARGNTNSTYPAWTTASPYDGVSVCLRYITDYLKTNSPSIFILSPSTSPLCLKVKEFTTYELYRCNDYNYLYLAPNVNFWTHIRSDFWNSVCLIVDSRKNVAQVFEGPNMSIRKVLPFQYVWSGEPVINFSGFEGQVTDVQVWDYPVRYSEVYYYMTNGFLGPYRGSVLSWSDVSYSIRGDILLEDAYEWQDKQTIIKKGKGRELKEKKKKFFTRGEKMKQQHL